MRGSIWSFGVLLIGVTLMATDVAAQSGEVATCSIACNAPGYEISWSVFWDEEPDRDDYDIVAAYMPDYGYQSAQVYYVPGPNQSTDGSEIVPHVPQYENGYPLLSVCFWFEWGAWWYHKEWEVWFWLSAGYTDERCEYVVGSCFAAGTPLLTPDGSKPIDQFKPGDWILTSPEDDSDAPPVARRVQEVIQAHGRLVDITVNDQIVHATREHPFFVKGKGWTPAALLTVGDLLRSHDDRWAPVESIVDAGESPVYNVRVEEHNTYFVGGRNWDFSLWVYGACNSPKKPLKQLATLKPVHSDFASGKRLSIK